MIDLSANIVSTGTTPEGLTATQLNTVKRIAYREMGEHFWRNNLPRRFTWAGARMLGYARRSNKYIAVKSKRKGHTLPLVWTGESRRLTETIRDVRSTATRNKTRTKIVLHARGLNRVNTRSDSPIRPSEEVRRIADREVPPLVRFLDGRMSHGFENNIPSTNTKQKVF